MDIEAQDNSTICPHCGGDQLDGNRHMISGYALTDFGWVDNTYCEGPNDDEDEIPY